MFSLASSVCIVSPHLNCTWLLTHARLSSLPQVPRPLAGLCPHRLLAGLGPGFALGIQQRASWKKRPISFLLFAIKDLPREWKAVFDYTQLFKSHFILFPFIRYYKMTFRVTTFAPDPFLFPYCSSWRAHQGFRDVWRPCKVTLMCPAGLTPSVQRCCYCTEERSGLAVLL